MKNNLLSWCFAALVIIVPIIGLENAFWLHQKSGIPLWLIRASVLVLPLVLWFEVVIKILFFKIIHPIQFTAIAIDPDTDIADSDLVHFNYYNDELKRLGFVKLTDFTAPSLLGVARLFAHL